MFFAVMPGAAGMKRFIPGNSLVAVALALVLSSCQTVKDAGSALFSGKEAARGPGLEASLRALGGSAADGSVRFISRGDGVTMLVQISGVPPGVYRVLVHANGNCSSPNGFSAGPPWSPPGAAAPLSERIPSLTLGNESSAGMTLHLSGVAVEGPNGLAGKSVVLHEGALGRIDAAPDVPNRRLACGVIGPLRTLF
ncbi:MAG: superoxide dismutase family protein [Betaproteobacteria bacterium]